MKGKAKKRPRTFIHSKKILPTTPLQEINPRVRDYKPGALEEKQGIIKKSNDPLDKNEPGEKGKKASFFNKFHKPSDSQEKPSKLLKQTENQPGERQPRLASSQKINRSHLYVIIVGLLIMLNIIVFGVIVYFQQKISRNAVLTQFSTDKAIETVPQLTNTDLNISARSAIIFDTQSRTAIYQKNADFRFAPASTTKIMTATIALERYNLNQIVTVPESVNQVVGSKMNLVAGERISVRNLLYGMLLPSGNDAAYVLATLDPGGVPGFVSKMNQKAKELKMDNTRFVDSSGYDDANYTSPFDLARLTAYALQNPMFQQIVHTRAITVTDVSGKIVHPLENLNTLLANSDVLGVKTGFTNEAGEVLVTSFSWRGRDYIIIVMHSQDRFADTQVLMNAIESSVRIRQY